MEALSSIFYFLLVIGIIVVIHELGHFLAARITGMRVEIFSAGFTFNPDKMRLFGWNRIKGFTFGNLPQNIDLGPHCDYRVSILPIGGFVKISGMVDESLDDNFKSSTPQPWEFRSKNNFQKALTLSAGVIMNFLLAIIIFAFLAFLQGKSVFDTTTIGYVAKGSIAHKVGFLSGDKVISINNNPVNDWEEMVSSFAFDDMGQIKKIKVERAGNIIFLEADGKKILKSLENKESLGFEPANIKTFLLAVETLNPAGKAGLQTGDTLLALNGITITGGADHFKSILKAHSKEKFELAWNRNGKIMRDSLMANENGMIGVQLSHTYTGSIKHVKYGFGEAFVYGFDKTASTSILLVSSIYQIFAGNLSFKQSFGGPIMIAQKASEQAKYGLTYLLQFMALLSISLGIINILPFPALDGGHLVFILIESIIRREVPVKVKMVFQQAGMIILLCLMALVFYFDIIR